MKRRIFFHLGLAATILVFLMIVLDGIIRSVSGSLRCPDWSECGGSSLLMGGQGEWIAFVYQSMIIGSVLLLLAMAYLTKSGEHKRLRLPVLIGLVLMIVIGMLSIRDLISGIQTQPWLVSVQLGLPLAAMALLTSITVAAWFDSGVTLRFSTPFSRLSLWVVLMNFILLTSGTLVTATGSEQACTNWPLCTSLIPSSTAEWINVSHRLIVGVTGILMFYLLFRAWKTQRTQTTVISAATASFVLFFSQALMGWFNVARGYPIYMVVLHEAISAAVWGALILLVAALGLAHRTVVDEELSLQSISGRKGLIKDLFLLTKPIVVALLLVTTFTGMVIGAQEWPSASLVFWTLLGGAMAAGGSGAINQYIDRYDDIRMQRTQKRPIPSGRMTPGEGLAWGIALCIASFFLLVAFVNLLAALLSLAGIIYYVLLYSIFLKKASVQNIVIGGGAGAIPPLVGWAAATGNLNIPSLFLFAVIFMWTPPHFWALAIVRKNDYARAGVPMLPVVRGETEARKQILIYTVELVVLTLVLPLFGLGQSIYLVSAVALGLWLLMAAVKVWKQEGNKVAWKMYRYSSMYLAFLFVALMIDRLILH